MNLEFIIDLIPDKIISFVFLKWIFHICLCLLSFILIYASTKALIDLINSKNIFETHDLINYKTLRKLIKFKSVKITISAIIALYIALYTVYFITIYYDKVLLLLKMYSN